MKETRVSALEISPQHIYKTTSTTGTSGKIVLSESIPGGANKIITIALTGYVNTISTTITYPVPFHSQPIYASAITPTTVVPTFSPSFTSVTISSTGTATASGTIVIIGV